MNDIADITMGQSQVVVAITKTRVTNFFFQGVRIWILDSNPVRLYTTEPKRIAHTNDTLMSVRAPVGDLNVAHTDCCIGRGLAAFNF